MIIEIFLILTACSGWIDREKAGSGGQHRCLGDVDLTSNICVLQLDLLDLLQVITIQYWFEQMISLLIVSFIIVFIAVLNN